MIVIPAVTERCAGIDVGKRAVAVAVLVGPADKEAEIKTREFGTTVPALTELRDWLLAEGCTSVAMESTGSYWIPVKNVLEGAVKILLTRPQKQKKGDKTDFCDAIHLGHRHRHGLVTGSYLPAREIVELRDLTRRRKKLLKFIGSEKNRIQKVLETGNVKIGNVVSDVFGISGQEIVQALLANEPVTAEQLANKAHQRLRNKIPQLTEALQNHHLNDHHRWLIDQSVEHLVMLDQQLERLEDRIGDRLKPYQAQVELLKSIPGVKEASAASVIAEIGPNMDPFPSAADLCSWAGNCPGNNRSAGKSKHSHIKKGNKFLLAALIEASWGAVRKQDSIFQRKFHRWSRKLGVNRAMVAVAHSLLRVIYAMLKSGQPYQEPDPRVKHELERQKLIRHHARRLLSLGADQETIESMIAKLIESGPTASANNPAKTEGTPPPAPRPEPVRRGALGFRARHNRTPYSNIKDQSAPTGAPQVKRIRAKPDPNRTTA